MDNTRNILNTPRKRFTRPLMIAAIVGVLVVACGGYATDIWAKFPPATSGSASYQDTSGNTRVTVGGQSDGAYGMRSWDSTGNMIYDLTNTAPRIAATISALGPGTVDGQTAYLRVGTAAPYEYVQLMWDATTSHWYTQPQTVATASTNSTEVQTSTSWAGVAPSSDEDRIVVPNEKALYDAGLRPQVFLQADIWNNVTGQSTSVGFALGSISTGGTIGQWSDEAAVMTTSASTGTYELSGWQDITMTEPTGTDGIGEIDVEVSGGNGLIREASAKLRWVG